MKSLIIVVSLLLGGFAHARGGHDHNALLTHLAFAKGAVHAHATWEAGPQVSSESLLQIEWKNGADHSPTEPPGNFEVELWMPSMGHGSAPTQIQRVLDAQGIPLTGVYQVSNVYFVMGGDWDVNVTLIYHDGTKETQTMKVILPTDDNGHHGNP